MDVIVFALIGGLVGGLLPDGHFAGFALGAALGVLAARLGRLNARLGRLEQQIAAQRAVDVTAARMSAARAETAAAGGEPTAASSAPASAPGAVRDAAPHAAPTGTVPRRDADRIAARSATPPKRSRLVADTEPSALERGLAALTRWFTTGNVPVKVGVLVSVFGVGFLVKEAIDRNWILLPLGLRLVLIALFGVVLLVLGWRLRERNPAYAVSVQGGGIAMLYVTIYAAHAVYGLLPAAAAFTMLLAVTAAGATLAVLQDARSLAVLGIVGGFLAPVVTSTDAGNHVVLFGYYAVLDLAILGIAWFKAWRALNVLGFFFTFGIGTVWGLDAYRPELFASTEPFLVLFVAIYMWVPVLFATRARPELKGFVDGTLVFGTPLVAFALQSQLVGDTRYGLAASALVLAAAYFVIAWRLRRARDENLAVLADAEFGLGAAFLALAVPLALDARWTSAAWAVQGAAMTWLGVRQRRRLASAAGALLQLAAGAVLIDHGMTASPAEGMLAGATLGAAMVAVAGAFSSRWLDRYPFEALGANASLYAAAYLAWGTSWWLAAGFFEIGRHAALPLDANVAMVFVGATVLGAVFAAQRLEWPRLNAVGFVGTGAIVLGALSSPLTHAHPLARFGWIAWPVLLGSHYVFLRLRERQFPAARTIAHASSYWAIALLVALETAWLIERVAGGAWPGAAALAAVAALVLLTLGVRERLAWPVGAHQAAYVTYACGGALAMLVAATLVANAVSPGDAAPLPYVPIANPLDLASAFVLFVAYRGWQAARAYMPAAFGRGDKAGLVLAGLGLVLLTAAVARAVHHLGGVPFDFERLAESTILQAALSIVWGTAALGGMLVGARTSRRDVWIAGAALMAVVVAKLFVVELGSTGTVARVVSFLGVGALLLVVGYFAPAPPRRA
ncbi:MAG TPA: DUF2339 domain-containing protein [Gammaproteobacteria bacterium]